MNKHNKVAEGVSDPNDPYLEYLGTFRELSCPCSSYPQLHSGVTLAELFLLIRGFKLVAALEDHPRTFSHHFHNLKLLLQSVEAYWNEQLQAEIEEEEIDMVEIGHSSSVPELQKFLSLFVKTAAKSDNQDFFIERILETSQQTQEFLKQIVEKAIRPPPKESPRKEKEKRMIDRLLELDHENEKLQQIISTICDEKEELEVKLRASSDLLLEKSQEIDKLRSFLNDQNFTPQKRRFKGVPDTIDRKDSQIDCLSHQLGEMRVSHQREVQDFLGQIQKLSYKALEHDRVKAELQLSQQIILNNKELIADAQSIEHALSHCKAELMNKDNAVVVMREKLEKYEQRLLGLEKAEVQLKGELERKNIHLLELAARIERTSPRKADTHHNLYLEFPEIINTEADAYSETNKTLREELERARLTIQKMDQELDSSKHELEVLRRCEGENKKLRELLIAEKSYKGEEVDVLVHALYHLRRRALEGRGALRAKNC